MATETKKNKGVLSEFAEANGMSIAEVAKHILSTKGYRAGGDVEDDDYAKKEREKLEKEKAEQKKVADKKVASDKEVSKQKDRAREIAENLKQKRLIKDGFKKDYDTKKNKYEALKKSYDTFMEQSSVDVNAKHTPALGKGYTKADQQKSQSALLEKLTAAENEYNNAKKIHEAAQVESNWNADGTVKSNSIAASKINTNVPKVTASVKAGEQLNKLQQTPADKLGTANAVTKAPSVKGYKKPEAPKTEVVTTDVKEVATTPSGKNIWDVKGEEALNKTIPKTKDETSPTDDKGANNKRFNWQSLMPIVGSAIETGASVGQIKLGLKNLQEAGKRPIGEIDPTFQANVDRAQAQSNYGFSPAQYALINQENQNATNLARTSARAYSGGSGGNAFTMERSAINEGFGRGLAAKVADTNLMMDKQQTANMMSLQKAQMSRQLFEDKMNAWQQNQQAGGQLLGAGITNLVGAGRYASEVAAQQERNKLYNS